MKTLGKIKLNQFRKSELEQREMNALKGGCSCSQCPCSCPGEYPAGGLAGNLKKTDQYGY